MNLLDQLWKWFTSPTAAAAPAQPGQSQPATIGDQLLRIATGYLNARTAEAQQRAATVNASAPADNAPGATRHASEAPLGQTLADLLKAYQQGGK